MIFNLVDPRSIEHHKGDKLNRLSFATAGYLTNGNRQVSFTIPIDKPLGKDVTGFKVTNSDLTVRQGGAYLTNRAVVDDIIKTTNKGAGLYTDINFLESIGGANNDPIGIVGTFDLEFT